MIVIDRNLRVFSELGFGETMMSGGPESLVERGLEKEPPSKAGAAEAVLMGALAQGVNVNMNKCFGCVVLMVHVTL